MHSQYGLIELNKATSKLPPESKSLDFLEI